MSLSVSLYLFVCTFVGVSCFILFLAVVLVFILSCLLLSCVSSGVWGAVYVGSGPGSTGGVYRVSFSLYLIYV